MWLLLVWNLSIVWQSGNHLTIAPSCGENYYSYSPTLLCLQSCIQGDGVLPSLYMLKSPAETKTRYEHRLLSVSVVGAHSQNVNICPDHWRFFNLKCHICILLESQFPQQLSAKIHPFSFRLDNWRGKASRHSKPQSINLQWAKVWIPH